MKKTLLTLLALFVLLVLYLLAWPVPVDPVAWTPPAAPALEGDYAPNTYLAAVERLDLSSGYGPEDVAIDSLGRIYGGLQDGRIIRMQSDGSNAETFADTGGRHPFDGPLPETLRAVFERTLAFFRLVL